MSINLRVHVGIINNVFIILKIMFFILFWVLGLEAEFIIFILL